MDLLRALEGAGLIERAKGEYPTLAVTRRGEIVADGHEDASAMRLPELGSGRGARVRVARVNRRA